MPWELQAKPTTNKPKKLQEQNEKSEGSEILPGDLVLSLVAKAKTIATVVPFAVKKNTSTLVMLAKRMKLLAFSTTENIVWTVAGA